MIAAFSVLLLFSVVSLFTNFDSVYFRFDLTLFTLMLLNFVIDIPSYHMPPGKRGNEQLTKSEVKNKQRKWQIFAVLLNKPFFALKHSA